MPRDKDLKRLVRARMKKTGEAYTAARAQLLRKAPAKKAAKPTAKTAGTSPGGAAERASARRQAPRIAAAPNEYGAVAGMRDVAVQEKTGRTWDQWVEVLDSHGAHEMKHRDIAALLHREYQVGGWWSQMVTVGYERIKGLRARGQRVDGSYEASKSRTFDVPVETLFDAWADAATRRRWLSDTGVTVRNVTAPKTLRLRWTDGTTVVASFTPKGAGRSVVALAHGKLPDKETADRIKRYWAERLDALGGVLARS